MCRPVAARTNNLRARTRARGFTLLELLIAMAMAAVLTLVLFEALKVASQANSSTERALAPSRSAQIAMDMLRQDFQNVPPSAAPAGTAAASSTGTGAASSSSSSSSSSSTAATLASQFEGQQSADDRGHAADIIDFYTLSDGQLIPVSQAVGNSPIGGSVANSTTGYGTNGNWMPAGETKFVEITIGIPLNSTDHCLVRRVWHNIAPLNPNLDVTQPQNPDEEEVICRGVESFAVRYYDGTEWLDSWDSTQEDNQIPAALEITLEVDRPATTLAEKKAAQTTRYVQIIQLPCSNVANDTNVSGTVSGLSGGFGQ